jgi:hypothetical protein
MVCRLNKQEEILKVENIRNILVRFEDKTRCGDLKRNNKEKEKIERRIFSSKSDGNCLDSHQPQLLNCVNNQSVKTIMVCR